MATRPFFETLREIRRGQILDDCADELAKAVRAVHETGKPAKLTIELSIKPAAKIPGTYVISDKVRAKLPELPVGETILYGTPEGTVTIERRANGAVIERQGNVTRHIAR